MKPLFPVGQIVATPACLDLLNTHAIHPFSLIDRHSHGDFGDLCRDDIQANRDALQMGGRLLSSYRINEQNDKIWVITEADRTITTLLLPEDY